MAHSNTSSLMPEEAKGIEPTVLGRFRQMLRDRSYAPILACIRTCGARPQSCARLHSASFRAGSRIHHRRRPIASSLPIEEALAAVAQQSEKQHVSGLILGIRSKVLEGHSLASSLREYPGSFSELYCSSVAAGEQSGFLDRVLENLAGYLERQFESSRNVEMALFYPVALLLLAFSIVGALMVYVIPDMINVIEDTGQTLPWFTVLLIGITDTLQLLVGIVAGFVSPPW